MFDFKKLAFAAAAVCLLSVPNAANAQMPNATGVQSHNYHVSHCSGNRAGVSGPLYRHGFYSRHYGSHIGFGHAYANILRSQAEANLLNAQARTQNEIARSARLDNNVKELQTYLERRRINSTARFAHLWDRGDAVRAMKASMPAEAQEERGRLTRDEVRATTGRLDWPLLLQMEHFNRARKPVNEIFKSRAISGSIQPDHYLPLCDWIDKVQAELDKNVDNYPKEDYAEAKDFLRRLVAEARLPARTTTMLAGTK